jgi:hypothetical protein
LELFYPTSITASLSMLLTKRPDDSLLSSPNVFTLHINSQMHRSHLKNRDLKPYRHIPDVKIENAYVVLPQSGKIKVRSTDALVRKEREKKERERYERNKEAWYERNELKLVKWGDDGSYGGEFSPWGEGMHEDSWGMESDEEDESTEDESTEDESTEDESTEEDIDDSDEDHKEMYHDDDDLEENLDHEDNQELENDDDGDLGEDSNDSQDQGHSRLDDDETDGSDAETDNNVSVCSLICIILSLQTGFKGCGSDLSPWLFSRRNYQPSAN